MPLTTKNQSIKSNAVIHMTNNFLVDYSNHSNNIYCICKYNNNEFRNLFHELSFRVQFGIYIIMILPQSNN